MHARRTAAAASHRNRRYGAPDHHGRISEDAMEQENVRRLIRFETARVDASRYDLSTGLPSLDMWFSYCYAQEGDFRAKFEAYNSMYNINAALMLTISLPSLMAAGASDLSEDDWKFRVIVYLLAVASAGFLYTLQKTSNWVTSGVTFIADDLDALAFISTYYPANLGSGYVGGVMLLTVATVFFVLDVLSHTPLIDRIVINSILGLLTIFAFMNQTFEWAYVFKKLAHPPTVFWDANAVDKEKALTVAHNNFEPVAPKKKLLPNYKHEGGNASDYNQVWDAAAGNFVTAAIDNSGQNNWVGVNEKCQMVTPKNPSWRVQEEEGFTTNLRDKLMVMRQFYDVPASEAEPNITKPQTGLSWLICKTMLNGSSVIDNPEYIQWMFTWQLKQEWASKLQGHIHWDTITLRHNGATTVAVAPAEGESRDQRDWQTVLDKACGPGKWSPSSHGALLANITPADLSIHKFAIKLTALNDLGFKEAAMRIKIANAL